MYERERGWGDENEEMWGILQREKERARERDLIFKSSFNVMF